MYVKMSLCKKRKVAIPRQQSHQQKKYVDENVPKVRVKTLLLLKDVPSAGICAFRFKR